MMRIREVCQQRGITRICHFTQSRNLAHILGDCTGILSTSTLIERDLPFNPTDNNRYDGCENYICCSIQYPNAYYFANVREQDHLFKDWVVLLIAPDFLWQTTTRFCPCNAARERGALIGRGYDSFMSLFTDCSPGRGIRRSPSHLLCSPTDIQAEVLVHGLIPLDAIIGIAVASEEQAKCELVRAELQGLVIGSPIFIAGDFFDKNRLVTSVRNGMSLTETLYVR